MFAQVTTENDRLNFGKQAGSLRNRGTIILYPKVFIIHLTDVQEVKYTPGVKRGRVWEPPKKKTADQEAQDSIPVIIIIITIEIYCREPHQDKQRQDASHYA